MFFVDKMLRNLHHDTDQRVIHDTDIIGQYEEIRYKNMYLTSFIF